jgi:hypothetical protein
MTPGSAGTGFSAPLEEILIATASGDAPDRSPSTTERSVVGLVCEPHGDPPEMAEHLARELARRLPVPRGDHWQVEISREPLPLTEDTRNAALLAHLSEVGRHHDWDLTVCIVDVPMRDGARPIVADANLHDRTALVSLPAFGCMRLRRRVRDVAEFVARALVGREKQLDSGPAGPFAGLRPDSDGIDLRVVATRGRWRLLIGMVRANRPWRLVFGLTGALAAAMAVGAYVLINSAVWRLALALGPLKLTAATVFAVVLMVAWLILDHQLWTPGRRSRRALLYNASTVLTLINGVLCMYAGVFAVVLAASTFTMDPGYFQSQIGRPVRVGDYFTVTWMASSMAIVAGALGTGFETEEAVRQAAYSYRERERRAAFREIHDRDSS